MSQIFSDNPLVHRDDVKFPLPAPYHAVLTVQDCQEIAELFVGTTRNPNHCISKGQYAKLTEQLAARNKMLEKRAAILEHELKIRTSAAFAWFEIKTHTDVYRDLLKGAKEASEVDGDSDGAAYYQHELDALEQAINAAMPR